MHHNYIANSSIIINIIVNGNNKTSDNTDDAMRLPVDLPMNWIIDQVFQQQKQKGSSEEYSDETVREVGWVQIGASEQNETTDESGEHHAFVIFNLTEN